MLNVSSEYSLENMNLLFLLAADANGLVDCFPCKFMSCFWWLIWSNAYRSADA